MTATIRSWTGNASPTAQVQTYKPGQQPANTTITVTVNGKTASYLSALGTNDDLIKGLLAAIALVPAPELREITFAQVADAPAVPSPNATTLKMSSSTPGQPFTVAISLTTPPTVEVQRTTAGRAGVNEQQIFKIAPNGQTGSFTATWSGQTTAAVPLPAQPLAAATGAGTNLVGGTGGAVYKYCVTFVTDVGETEAGAPTSLAIAASATNDGALTNIPVGPSTVLKRRVYRTKANGSVFFFLHEIADNTTTSYTDATTDANLGLQNPPATNFAFEGAVQALSNVGANNFKVGGANLPAVASTDPATQVVPLAIEYVCEFVGTLGSAAQALMTGDVTNVVVLPTITITEVQVGCPVQSAIQTVGWAQVLGQAAPSGNLRLAFPDLGVTTGPIDRQAAATGSNSVLAAIQAAVPPAYVNSFAVASVLATNNGYTWSITYQGLLANRPMQQCQVDVSGLSPATGDTLTPVQKQTQVGSATGQDEIFTATINNNPSGGNWYLKVLDAATSTLLSTSTAIGNDPTAANVQTALGGASYASVSGSTGGPFTIGLVGELGSRKCTVLWASSLTGAGAINGSPPSSNTTGISTPSGVTVTAGQQGCLAPGTYYWVVTAVTAANNETNASAEVSAALISGTGIIRWIAVTGAATYNIYRGTSSGLENVLVASGITDTIFNDVGQIHSPASPPGSNTAGVTAPSISLNAAITTEGQLASNTYYYKATLTTASGETTGSNEVSAAVTGPNGLVGINVNGVLQSGVTGIKLYRGTSSGSETTLLGTYLVQTNVGDSNNSNTSQSPPASNNTLLSAPVQTNPSTSTSAGNLTAGTYYYAVTAVDGHSETTASNEKSATLGATGEITVNWNTVAGASGYKIYRGLSASGENVLVGIVTSGSTVTFTDLSSPLSAVASIVETAAGAAPQNEIQTITINGATSGSYELAESGLATTLIAYNDLASSLQADLQALLGAGNIAVTGPAGGPYTLTFQGDLAGSPQPLLVALPGGLVGSVTTAQSLVTVASATGPNNWDNAANWSPAGVPVSGDSAVFQNNTTPCLYGLDQHLVTLLNLVIDMSYAGGKIGLPANNGKYYEYRPQYLQIGVSGTITIGNGKGTGPSLIKLDTGTVAATILVNGCGNSSDPSLPTIIWKGNRSSGSTVITINKGKLAIAPFIGETAHVDSLSQNYVSNIGSDTYVLAGPGAVITTWNKTGGDADCYTSVTTLEQENGTFSLFDGPAAVSTVTTCGLLGGTFYHAATGAITTLSVGTGATYDRSDDSRAVTITNTKIYGKSTFLDPHGSIVFTNNYQLIGCGYEDLAKPIQLGKNITGARTNVSF